MRKLLLIGLVALGVACQKDYYLDDLNDANARIEALQGQLSDLSVELQQSIADNNTKAEELIVLETKIADLNIEIEQLVALNLHKDTQIESLINNLYVARNEIEVLNTQIAELQGQLADALEQAELDIELITNLNNQITELENRESEIIIEYIETIVEIQLPGSHTVSIVEPDYTTWTAQQLHDRIDELTALIESAPDPVVYSVTSESGATGTVMVTNGTIDFNFTTQITGVKHYGVRLANGTNAFPQGNTYGYNPNFNDDLTIVSANESISHGAGTYYVAIVIWPQEGDPYAVFFDNTITIY